MNSCSLKFTYSLIAALLFMGSLQSQIEPDTTIFAPVGATWYYSTWVQSPYPELLKFVVDGEILLNDTLARVLKFYSGESGELIEINGLEKYVFTSGEKVYYWVNDAFYLLYDFGAETGDTIISRVEDFPVSLSCFADFSQGPLNFSYKIDSVGSVQIDGQNLRSQYVTPLYTSGSLQWIIENPIIERFGQLSQSCFWWGRGEGCSLGGFPGELRCYEDEEIYFKNPYTQFDLECDYLDEITSIADTDFPLFPNPTKNVLFLSEFATIINAYNLTGSKVKTVSNNDRIDVSDLPPDIYIIQYQINEMWHSEKFVKI